MNRYKPCECGCQDIDWGTGYTIEKCTIRRYIYARCKECGYEKLKIIHDDTFYSMTVSLAEKIALELWNEVENDKG